MLWLADSALQWKSARIPWLEVSRDAGKSPEVKPEVIERAKSYVARKLCDAISGVVTRVTLVRGRSLDPVDNQHLNWALGRFQF
jgi:hypothetical protein